MLIDWLGHSQQYKKYAKGILVRRTMPELDDVIRRSRELFGALGATYSESKREWTMPGGGVLRMRYLESIADAAAYQGHAYTWVGVDEAGSYPKPDVIDLLRGCMRSAHDVRCYIRLTGNPGGPGQGWLKDRYITPAPPEVPHTDEDSGLQRIFIPSKLEDNPHINDPEAYKKRLSGAGPPHIVRAWLHGDWNSSPEGGVLNVKKVVRDQLPKAYRVYCGIDPAVSPLPGADKTAIAAWAVARIEGEIHYWLLDCDAWIASSDISTTRILDFLDKWAPIITWMEGGPVGQGLIPWVRKEMKTRKRHSILMCSHAGGDKLAKAASLQAAMNDGSIHVEPGATHWPMARDAWTMFDGQKDMPDDLTDATGIPLRFCPAMMGKDQPADPTPKVERSSLDRKANPIVGKPRGKKTVVPLFGGS